MPALNQIQNQGLEKSASKLPSKSANMLGEVNPQELQKLLEKEIKITNEGEALGTLMCISYL